ncbi:MAG: RHS repeat-associated core domain-containing protein [Bacillaceae bacterium]|nr:RHS repeat-associated core domain-containing protein [Bacillaceae bacterium]
MTGITAPYNHNGYTGQRYDAKSSFIDMNARWYDPSVGRFLTPDTYRGELTNPLTQNRYAYVLNNPVNMWDPTGHVPVEVDRYDDAARENFQIREVLGTSSAFGFGSIPSQVYSQSNFDDFPDNISETETLITFSEYHFVRYQDEIVEDSVEYVGKYIEDDQYFYYQFEGQWNESWTYDETKYRQKVHEGDLLGSPISIGGSTDDFERQSILYWEVKVSASLAAGDHQEIIIENYGTAPEVVDPEAISNYDEAKGPGSIISGTASSESGHIIHSALDEHTSGTRVYEVDYTKTVQTPFGTGLTTSEVQKLYQQLERTGNPYQVLNDVPDHLRDGVSYQLKYLLYNSEEYNVWEDAPEQSAKGLLFAATSVVSVEAIAIKGVTSTANIVSKTSPKLWNFTKNQLKKAQSLFKRKKPENPKTPSGNNKTGTVNKADKVDNEGKGNIVDTNKLNHIFGKQQHNLDDFLRQHGDDQVKAYNAILNSTQKHVDSKKINGVFEEVVNVNGTKITVRGNVVNGEVKIGTAFIP